MSKSIEKLINDIENKAIPVIASNGRRVLKEDIDTYELLLKSKDLDINEYKKSTLKDIPTIKLDTISKDKGYKVVDINKFDWKTSFKNRKYYLNSFLLTINNKLDNKDEYKNIMFKIAQFLVFYKNRDKNINIRFIIQIEAMIKRALTLSIGEKEVLYGKLSKIAYLTERQNDE